MSIKEYAMLVFLKAINYFRKKCLSYHSKSFEKDLLQGSFLQILKVFKELFHQDTSPSSTQNVN